MIALLSCGFIGSGPAQAQLNTVILNEDGPFAEGSLLGYTVQAFGETLCADPVAWGRYIVCGATPRGRVWVETNGTLGAYIVVDAGGNAVCRDPEVWNQFRGSQSFIVCN
jgi:hypothetical protein